MKMENETQVPQYNDQVLKILDTVAASQNAPLVSHTLKGGGGSNTEEINKLKESFKKETERRKKAHIKLEEEKGTLAKELDTQTEETKRLSKLVTEMKGATLEVTSKVEATGEIPDGEVEWVDVKTVFPEVPRELSFNVPVWQWKAAHPYVPQAREGYIFRLDLLLPVLYSIVHNDKCWLTGHTGSGKTTLIEQVANRLGYPFICINFDSEITRGELIGKIDLISDGGTTVTKWIDGILPQAMAGPFLACFDELDFVRPDVAYVMQRVLEGNSLRILEDAGREVKPHEMFRMFATGNTKGSGDEFGLYQGARPQSMAFLNRFTSWVEVPYMDESQIQSLITTAVPALSNNNVNRIASYSIKHQNMFQKAEVLLPMTPRTFTAVATKTEWFTTMGMKEEDACRTALESSILSQANTDDRNTLSGLISRIF
jgi:cobaltochelatase CobS